ncbi:MAG TPA: flagellar hook protein FlgE [Polyangiaceae bacterium]|nr:flagellar hook protein FlgE [Polyangiaceae bacterium]
MTLRALENGVSGLRAEGEALGVVGDNIANVNTTGFKRQRSIFEDVLLKSGSGNGSGAGVENSRTQQAFTQGALTQTGIATDLALNGDGFFVVTGATNGVTGAFYTRSGQFKIDASGYLVNPEGLKLVGRPAKSDGTLAAGVSSLQVPTAGIPARATANIQLAANLDASAPAATFDPLAPSATANASTSIQIYDSLGAAHSLDIYFEKVGDGQWNYHAFLPGSDLDPVVAGPTEVGAGSLTFNSNGALDSVATNQAISVSFGGGAIAGQTVALEFGSTIADGGTGLDGTTQFSMPSSTSSESQDGYASGALSGVSIGSTGVVEGLYSNGLRLPVGQLVVAKFRSQEGLGRAGQGLWVATAESGDPALGAPGSGGRGSLSSGALEASNVDLGEEFVGMITHQRAYSANSKVIATADDMLSMLMQMKR